MSQRHEDPQFKFRIPAVMKARLENAAQNSGRTLTAEILQRLEASFTNGATSSEEAFLRSQIESIDYQIHNMNEMIAGQTSDADNDADRMIRLTVMTHISILARQRAELEGRLIALHGAKSG